MKTKTRIIVIAILCIMVFVYIGDQVIDMRAAGYHNPLTGKVMCGNYSICLHEVGHKIDKEGGRISETEEWKYAVTYYRVGIYSYLELRDHMSLKIMFFPGIGGEKDPCANPFTYCFWHGGYGGHRELYPEILKWSGGNPENMPEIFREFYDWNRIAELMSNLGVIK